MNVFILLILKLILIFIGLWEFIGNDCIAVREGTFFDIHGGDFREAI